MHFDSSQLHWESIRTFWFFRVLSQLAQFLIFPENFRRIITHLKLQQIIYLPKRERKKSQSYTSSKTQSRKQNYWCQKMTYQVQPKPWTEIIIDWFRLVFISNFQGTFGVLVCQFLVMYMTHDKRYHNPNKKITIGYRIFVSFNDILFATIEILKIHRVISDIPF